MNEFQKEPMSTKFRAAFSKSSINNIINTPNSYTTRARNDVKKLLAKPTDESDMLTMTSPSNQSIYLNDMSSYDSSLFSSSSTLSSQYKPNPCNNTNVAYTTDNYEYYSNTDNISVNNIKLPPLNFITMITLRDAIPKDYSDMYSVATFQQNEILPNGRPKFTQRDLMDWDINDIRSLLIVDKLKPAWGNSIPMVTINSNEYSVYHDSNGNLIQFRIILLPLHSSEQTIIDTLVNSDLYMESGLDYEFRYAIAKYIVESVKKKYESIPNKIVNGVIYLDKITWRNVIENYLLNIAVEAQCRFDFRQRCRDFEKWKLDNLKQGSVEDTRGRIVLTKEEKLILWSQCQAQVYQRLSLDWKPDKV